ncbi:hypothetical protein CDV52_07065 [Haematobacter missouriensis]|uniref:YncE family protein n=1 Tax=Haematobacter missouriensis TaxID=366616 RepID=A0A212ATE4_9RHOB|nr:hypothetical protein [Haematobacter missouriensis]OWJ84771.1 hypothetical protein CDV52_07065 [Haematobacter missouriensis]
MTSGLVTGGVGGICAALLLFGSPAAALDLAVVTSQNAGKVTILDLQSGAARSTLDVPGDPVSVAVDGRNARAFVVAVKSRMLHVIGLDGREIMRHPLPGAPFGIAYDPISRHVFVTDWEGHAHEVEPATGTVVRSFETGANPSGIAVSDDGRLLAVTDRDSDALSLFDLGSGAVVERVSVGHHPFGVTLREGQAYVADVLDNSVTVVDLGRRTVVGKVETGERPYAVAFAAGRGFVTDQYGGTLTVFDPGTLAVTGQVTVGDYPEGISVAADGRTLFVANWLSDSVMRIDGETLTVEQEIAMPPGPRAFGSFIADTN